MGNCSSEHQAKLFRAENFTNDPTAFRVFVKKKNQFIPGWLKINDSEIVFTRGNGGTSGSANNFHFWPLAYLRRYGYTCSGIFFFESGRRCVTGEGLHTFQSHQAEKIFQMVQDKIKIEEYTRSSRASSVASNHRVKSPSQQPNNRIHPVQRFSSEGKEYRPNASPSLDSTYSSCPPCAPPPYEAYQRSLQEAINRRQYAATSPGANYSVLMTGRQRDPSTSFACATSVYSTAAGGVHLPANGVGSQRTERPRSVVSALAHGTCSDPFMPSPMNNPAHPSINGQFQYQQQQQQQRMSESMNAGHPLDRSFTSGSMSGSRMFTASPWASQQQLENEIVHEHVLSKNTRKYHHQLQEKLLALGQQYPSYNNSDSQSYCGAFAPSSFSPTGTAAAAATLRQRKYHSYVNVDLPSPTHLNMSTSCYGTGSNSNMLSTTKLLAARELHRTNKSRQEFLSSQPGGFIFNNALSNFNPILTTSTSSELPPAGFDSGVQRSSSQSLFTTLVVDGGGTRVRKRVPQLPLSPFYQSSGGQQNYTLINSPPATHGSGLTVTDVSRLNPPTVFDAGPITNDESNGGEAPPLDPRTNYALIDYQKTKALESAANVKAGQPPVPEGAFV